MQNSKIQWTDNTWQVNGGCSRVSPGCTNCYAERLVGTRHRHLPMQSTLTEIRGDGKPHWTNVIALYEKNLLIPLSWKEPRMIFVNSLSDLFHPGVPFDYIDRVFAIMALCPQHIFQVLTKRPEIMREYLNDPDRDEAIAAALGNMLDGEWIWKAGKNYRKQIERLICQFLGEDENERLLPSPMPLPHVHCGTSAENQEMADLRLPVLGQCRAAVRFVSYEPALEGVDFTKYLTPYFFGFWGGAAINVLPVDQIIIGGESGPGARPFDLAWAERVVRDCQEAGVPVFLKQLGAFPVMSEEAWFDPTGQRARTGKPLPDASKKDQVPPGYVPILLADKHGGEWDQWPVWMPRVREFPKPVSPILQRA